MHAPVDHTQLSRGIEPRGGHFRSSDPSGRVKSLLFAADVELAVPIPTNMPDGVALPSSVIRRSGKTLFEALEVAGFTHEALLYLINPPTM